MDKIDVIIPCWITQEDTLELTKSAIHSLGKVRLIIIDNASTVGGGYLRSVADVYVRNSKNLGFAPAVNQGLKLATSQLIAVSNNDIKVSPNWADVARDVLLTESTYSCHFKMTDYDTPFTYGDDVFYTGRERWCTTSFFVINTQKALFYFDENFRLGGYEDYDYWWTVRGAGFQTAYTNKAVYQHQHSHTQQKLGKEIIEAKDKHNLAYFKDKWGSEPEELFKKAYPKQWEMDYWRGFDIS